MDMEADAIEETIDFTLRKPAEEEEEKNVHTQVEVHENVTTTTSVVGATSTVENLDKIYVADNGLFMLHKDHPDYLTLIKLQLENQVI